MSKLDSSDMTPCCAWFYVWSRGGQDVLQVCATIRAFSAAAKQSSISLSIVLSCFHCNVINVSNSVLDPIQRSDTSQSSLWHLLATHTHAEHTYFSMAHVHVLQTSEFFVYAISQPRAPTIRLGSDNSNCCIQSRSPSRVRRVPSFPLNVQHRRQTGVLSWQICYCISNY